MFQNRSLMMLVAVTLAGSACASTPSSRADTADALDTVLAGAHRSPEDRSRDAARHPKETLLFFGIRPEMTVVEVWPAAGWYTDVIAPLVRERGRYYAAHWAPNPERPRMGEMVDAYRIRLAAQPAVYGDVSVTALGAGALAIAPPDSADMVLTFRNIHNWMGNDFTETAIAAMYRALKPGGVLGVVEHRGNPATPQDPKAKSGYVNEDYAIRTFEAAGFKLVGKSEVNANPRDTKDYPKGVWTLPPTYAEKDVDRGKYTAIGESDRFTLKFVKPGG